VLKDAEVRISMDGRGRAYDNIFIERLWRTVKYEEVYLHDYQTVAESVYGLRRYFGFYNDLRLHQSLGYRTPAEVYGVRGTAPSGGAATFAAGRVGAGACAPAPLTEPDLWVTHPAPQVGASCCEQHQLLAPDPLGWVQAAPLLTQRHNVLEEPSVAVGAVHSVSRTLVPGASTTVRRLARRSLGNAA